MYQLFTLTFIQSFIIKLQRAKYKRLYAVTTIGKVEKPGKPTVNTMHASITSPIIANSKFLPIDCFKNRVGVRTTNMLNILAKNRMAKPKECN